MNVRCRRRGGGGLQCREVGEDREQRSKVRKGAEEGNLYIHVRAQDRKKDGS